MDAYTGEIRIFAGNFAPSGWAICDGSVLPISTHTALFALLGTAYGGDGRSTFALPDLRGRAPMHQGQGDGLSRRDLGDVGGAPAVTLTESAMPVHNHQAQGTTGVGAQQVPTGSMWAQPPGSGRPPVVPKLYVNEAPDVSMNPLALAPVGGGQAHNNVQPALGLNYVICLNGYFPPRS